MKILQLLAKFILFPIGLIVLWIGFPIWALIIYLIFREKDYSADKGHRMRYFKNPLNS